MKNILNRIYIHPLTLLTFLIFIIIGRFKFLTYFMTLILIHELGHILTSIFFKWNIEKIIILPFGGLIRYKEYINKPLREEFLVAIMGVIFQYIFYLLIKNNIDYKYFSLINYFIMIFNLLPIYPLDGSKILSVFLNKIMSFKKSNIYIINISHIFIILGLILFFYINKLFIVVFFFLFIEVIKLNKNEEYIFNKFLLERYLNDFNFKRRKIVNNIFEMKKDYKHLFLIDNKYITEKEKLKKMFDNNNIL